MNRQTSFNFLGVFRCIGEFWVTTYWGEDTIKTALACISITAGSFLGNHETIAVNAKWYLGECRTVSCPFFGGYFLKMAKSQDP
jgi:hypothetical protein